MATPRKTPGTRSKTPQPLVHPAILAYKAQKAKRTCVHCDRVFSSRSPSHRICGKCRRRLGDLRLPTIYRSELSDHEQQEG